MKPKNMVTRDFKLETRAIDDENRKIEFSFSSETPVERFFGFEILDHKPASVRLGRLNDGGPLLLDHNARDSSHIGIVESATIADSRGKAVARFASTPEADRVFDMVKDGIKRNVSVGYRVHRVVLEESTDSGPDTYRVIDWEPIELSLVTMGADNSVGIGRDSESEYPYHLIRELETMKTQTQETAQPTEPTVQPQVDVRAIENEARAKVIREERERSKNINAIIALNRGNKEVADLGYQCLEDGVSLQEFQSRVIPLLARAKPLPLENDPVTRLGMEKKQIRDFSILRIVRAIVAAQQEGTNPEKIAPFELECSRAIADKLNRNPRGFFVPFDVQEGSVWGRAVPMDTSENADLVATEHLAANFIDVLKATAIVIRAGAQTLPGLEGNVDIPAFLTASAFGWLAEDADSANTEPTTGTVSLTPKTVSGSVPITRRLLKQSAPSVEMLVRNDLITGAALAIDAGALQGPGTGNAPLGAYNQTGINTVIVNPAGTPTWGELVDFETKVATDNALRGSLRYMVTPAVAGFCKTTAKDAGSGLFLMSGGEINGYVTEITTQMPADGILFGNFNDILIGFWGVLDINVDVATKAASGGIVLRAFQDVDVAVRHAVSFCKDVLA